MATMPVPTPGLPAPPWEAFHRELLELADGFERAGDGVGARRLRDRITAWREAQDAWNVAAADLLRVHHEINNALVGVSGNAQLLRVGAIGQQGGARERLEVILRESARIEHAARRLRELRVALIPDPPAGPPSGGMHVR